MNHPDPNRLAFLLSLGSLPLAACFVGDDVGDDDGGEADDSVAESPITMTDPTDGTGGMTAGMTSDSAGSTDPATTDPGETSATTQDPTAADTSTGAVECGAEVPDFCEPYVAHALECYGRGYFSVEYCACNVAYAEMYGDECVTAYEEYYACIIAADCEQLTAGKACGPETTALDTLCSSGDTSGTG
jgi:hypothetical protein